jgi:hypothetical protein
MLMPDTTKTPKRIVFEHHTGLTLICGVLTELPVTLPPFQVLGETIPFSSLFKVTSRAAYYKAPTVPQSFNSAPSTFHEAQR